MSTVALFLKGQALALAGYLPPRSLVVLSTIKTLPYLWLRVKRYGNKSYLTLGLT